MSAVLDTSLFENNPKRFQQISDLTKQFIGVYCVDSIIGENIFQFLKIYARKKMSLWKSFNILFRMMNFGHLRF